MERFPDGPREIVARGHEVALHCHRHRNHLRLIPGQTVDDMRRAKAALEDASGRPVRLFRPPYGIFNAASWYEAGRQGWDRMLWSRWGRDWEERATPGSVAEEIGVPEAGDVLLLHDSGRYASTGSASATRGALPVILERLSARELRALPAGDLLDARER